MMKLFTSPTEKAPFGAVTGLFGKSIVSFCKGHVLLHFRQRVVEQEGSPSPGAEQRRQVHQGSSLCKGTDSVLGVDFTGVRRTSQVPTAPP